MSLEAIYAEYVEVLGDMRRHEPGSAEVSRAHNRFEKLLGRAGGAIPSKGKGAKWLEEALESDDERFLFAIRVLARREEIPDRYLGGLFEALDDPRIPDGLRRHARRSATSRKALFVSVVVRTTKRILGGQFRSRVRVSQNEGRLRAVVFAESDTVICGGVLEYPVHTPFVSLRFRQTIEADYREIIRPIPCPECRWPVVPSDGWYLCPKCDGAFDRRVLRVAEVE